MGVAAVIVGCLLVLLALRDAFEVVLLPRRASRGFRFTAVFFRAGWGVWRTLARAVPGGEARERLLSVFGPLIMLGLFALWAAGLILGFGLIQWGADGIWGPGARRLFSHLYFSGVTFFTLGYGDLAPRTDFAKAAAVMEAGVGFGLIALVIGYLPVLYQLFSRREAHVLQLDARAGSPPTAAVLLRRHTVDGELTQLDPVFLTWEIWGAELLESHLSYPMLAYYRSQHDDQSWLAALAAVLDACALVLVSRGGAATLQARMTFAILRQVVVEMARSLRIAGGDARAGMTLAADGYAELIAIFEDGEVPWPKGPEVEETLAAMRATYAPLVHGLAGYLMIPLPGLAPATDAPDHWDRGPRGLIARRLMEELAETTPLEAPFTRPHGRTFAARLRNRLR
ncbi:MAG TPA: potassium channel family protein [Caulobacteraceae bacterium]|nr:potassium channel family protein [Caulobacteraceae bacterium]